MRNRRLITGILVFLFGVILLMLFLDEADERGISFILLAGGEPMLRRDIIEAAGKRQKKCFPSGRTFPRPG